MVIFPSVSEAGSGESEKSTKNGYVLQYPAVEVKAVDSEDSAPDYEYRKYPALKLARMAVDVEFEKKGIGRFLLYAAIGKALLISEQIGCRYLTVDSKPESVGFYDKHGFKFIKKYKN